MDFNVSISNQLLRDAVRDTRLKFKLDPTIIYPWWRPCRVRTLLVTDGPLDFGTGDFGLSTFVQALQIDRPVNMRFDLTLAHLRSDISDAGVMQGASGIVRSIKGFRFDEGAHFDPDAFDEVWLFGFETFFHRSSYAQRLANQARYPSDRLGDGELRALSGFMNGGGGVFATGDHGSLGRGLCGSVSRVRGMRWWNSFSTPGQSADQVSMSGAWRNDTNQIGADPGSQFSDQSDDVPQKLDLKLYASRINFFTTRRFPHPVMCGRDGRIEVFPDHPHEGECRVPDDLATTYDLDGSREYPDATAGGGAVSPEVIAWSRVPAGNDARGSKQPTVAHRFGAVSAYDGHRAGVGRVICDATWHHFVNVNLIGVVEGGGFDEFANAGENPAKHDGFLASAAGMAVLDRIRNYYSNIGGWIARPERIACAYRRLWWIVVYKERIMEAALVDPDTPLARLDLGVLRSIGIHARDVIGRLASQCQSLQFTLVWLERIWPEIPPWLDPWDPRIEELLEKEPPLPIFDPTPLADVAFGAALVAMRQAAPYPPQEIDDDFEAMVTKAAMEGARSVLERAIKRSGADLRDQAGSLGLF